MSKAAGGSLTALLGRGNDIVGPASPPLPSPRATAYHEAGHADARRALGWPLHSVTVIPDEARGTLGACYGADPSTPDAPLPGRMMPGLGEVIDERIVVLWAGPLAEVCATGQPPEDSTLARSDFEEIERLAEMRCPHAHERRLYLAWCRERAQRIVDDHLDEIHKLAAALLERGTITGAEARAIAQEAA